MSLTVITVTTISDYKTTKNYSPIALHCYSVEELAMDDNEPSSEAARKTSRFYIQNVHTNNTYKDNVYIKLHIHCEAKKLHHFIFAITLSNLSLFE